MKVIAILLFATLLQVRAAGFAQQITLNQKNVSLKQVFNEINKQTGYNILWSPKKVMADKVFDVNLNKATIQQALNQTLAAFPLTYTIDNRTIVIKEKEAPVSTSPVNKATFIDIKGKVTDESGAPLPGASVKVKGTSRGVTTDPNGNYAINASAGDVLVFSFIGFVPSEATVGTETTINIMLKESPSQLSQVVVTALGIKKQTRTLSYNVQEIGGAEVNRVKDPNFVNSLAGKVAGVTINSSSAGPGASSRVVLRGTKSISSNNNALYVIDGVPMPSLQTDQPGDVFSGAGQTGDAVSNINPDDIESLSVLTGPSAAALYGNRGANGVILITTKRGNKESFSATVTNNTTFGSPFVMPRFQNTYGSEVGSFTSWGDKLQTPSTYDPKDFFQTAVNTTTSLSVSTGTEKSQSYISAAAVNASGIIHNNDLKRYNFSFRNTTKFLNDKLNLDVSLMYVKLEEQNMLAQGQYFNPLVPIYLFPRGDDIRKYQVFERYNATRNFKTQFWPFGDQGFQMQNPYWITERDMFGNDKNRYMITASLQYNINSWMNITGRVKLDQNNAINQRKYSASTAGLFASDAGAYYRYAFDTRQSYADVLLNINKPINKDFNLTANVGASIQDDKYDGTTYGGNLQSVPNLFTYNNISLTDAKPNQDGYHDQLQAAFGTAQLGYKSMVYLDVTARADWASALVNTSSKAIFYPSVGLSGAITDIFDIKSNFLTFLKARGSYSEVGNAPRRFTTIPTYPLANGSPQLETYKAFDLKPERTKSYEAGMNFIFGQNKVKLDVTAYKSSTFNQLFNPTVSAALYGYNSFYLNAGQIDNKGIEVSATLNQNLGPVKWNSGLVFSLNRNKIKQLLPSFTDPETGANVALDSLNMGGTTSYRMILKTGGSMGDIYVNTLKTDEHGYIYVNSTTFTVTPDQNRYVKAGNANPKYNLGWRNGFSYKGVDLNFLVTARIGGVGVSNTQAILDRYGVSEASALARDNGGAVVNGYKLPAQPYYEAIGGGTSGVGSLYVYSATNVRLGEASIGYEVPIKKYAKWVKGLNVSLIGRNLFMFYNKAPFDPENTANTGTYYQGIDYFMQPSLRNLGFSARLSF